jgi:hypothetical protein
LIKDWGFIVLDDLPAPFMVGGVKIWPAHSRPGYSWFIAHEGKPYYFRSRNEAVLFAKDAQSGSDPEGLCD